MNNPEVAPLIRGYEQRQTVLLRSAGGALADIEHAERGGIVCHFPEFVQLNRRVPHAELHVGLSGCEPDFADQDVFDFRFFSVGDVFDRKNMRFSRRFNRGKTEHEISGRGADAECGNSGDACLDDGIRCGFAPHRPYTEKLNFYDVDAFHNW